MNLRSCDLIVADDAMREVLTDLVAIRTISLNSWLVL